MKNEKILIVDDVEINREILCEMLSDDYDIIQAENGVDAIDILFNTNDLPIVILLDIMMPEMDGYEVLALIKENPNTASIPVIFITAADASENESHGLQMGAADYITKPFNNPYAVKARVDNHAELKRHRDSLSRMVDEKVAELMNTRENVLEVLATIIEYRNLESGQHVKRTCLLSKILINHMLNDPEYNRELTESNFNLMVKAAALHDIGKIGIPDNILLKPGKLTPEEFEIIKTHSVIGSDIIKFLHKSDTDIYLIHCRNICRSHHECWSGTGYPDGLKGAEIPLSARILSVVDVYDALVSQRVYKPARTHEEAMSIILEGSGTKFDPGVIKALLKAQEEFLEISKKGDNLT